MVLMVCAVRVPAQPVQGEVSSAAAMAARQEQARQEVEERYRRMAADLETLGAQNQALEKSVEELRTELSKVREEQSRAAAAAANSSVQEDLKRLAKKIEDVDKKRESDNQLVSEEIKNSMGKIAALIAKTAAAPHPSAHVPVDADPPAHDPIKKGYTYTVEPGDSLGGIVKAYNDDYKSKGLKTITKAQVIEANPNINLEKLRAGQKIVIPASPSSN